VKPSDAANDALVQRTRQVWQPRLGRDLSREDVRQITENLTGFFALIAEWSRAETTTSANDNDEGAPTNLIVAEEKPTVGGDRNGRGR
jgi:hypothetical protein